MIKKICSYLEELKKIFKEFGFKYAYFYFLKKFLFRKNKGIGKRIYYKNYEYIKKGLLESYGKPEYYKHNINIDRTSTIWFFWWQGSDNMPENIKMCLETINQNKKEHKIIIVDKDNISNYCPNIPMYIYEKLKKGYISITHFSDIVRMCLLYEYGGIWMDATIILSNKLDDEIYRHSFFTIQHGLFSDFHVCKGKWSGFFIASNKKHPIIGYIKDSLFKYWEEHNVLICYLLIDCFIAICYENNDLFKEEIDCIGINNQNVFFIDDFGNEKFDQKNFEKLNTNIFKIHYKRNFYKYKNNYLTYFGYVTTIFGEKDGE